VAGNFELMNVLKATATSFGKSSRRTIASLSGFPRYVTVSVFLDCRNLFHISIVLSKFWSIVLTWRAWLERSSKHWSTCLVKSWYQEVSLIVVFVPWYEVVIVPFMVDEKKKEQHDGTYIGIAKASFA